MSKELDAKLKTALDESRLLILGAQVLFGFAFQAAFQELFAEVDAAGRTMQILAPAKPQRRASDRPFSLPPDRLPGAHVPRGARRGDLVRAGAYFR
jgi:Family of unknown function (DUF6328)